MTPDPGSQLSSLLPAERVQLLHLVGAEAAAQRVPLYLLGGTVRDLLLGRTVRDIDLVVEGDAIQLARSLESRHGGRVTAHSKFGTAKWILPGNLKPESQRDDALDLISARSETYKAPGALPAVKPGNMDADIRRRDFTINALAIRLDGGHFGELRDEVGGLEDLRKGIVRVLHPRSFIDDPTRMYRAVRYEQRYGFRISEDTLALIPAARALVNNLSPKRIRHELDLILDETGAASVLARLDALDLLSIIHPALATFRDSSLAKEDTANMPRQTRWLLWLMHVPEQDIEALNTRLHFTAGLLRNLRSASRLYSKRQSVLGRSPSQTVQILDGYSQAAIEAVSEAATGRIRNVLSKYLSEWRHTRPRTTGHDLKARGIRPGPKYTEILRRLRSAWLDGEVKTREQEEELLEQLLR